MKRRGLHILTDQERDCMAFRRSLRQGFRTPEDLSDDMRIGTGRMYTPARVLEIAAYCAKVDGDVDIWYNAGVSKQTLIRFITSEDFDRAIAALTYALQDVRAKKTP